MILFGDTPNGFEEVRISPEVKAEQQLDQIYHAIPEWVHRLFPDKSLAERVKLGFSHQEQYWANTLRELHASLKLRQEFIAFLMENQKLDFMENYWKFLTSKDLQDKEKSDKTC